MISGRSKLVSSALLCLVLIALVFIIIKACLALYDENFLTGRIIIFQSGGERRFVCLRQFNETTYYSSEGNFEQKSFSFHYFLQARDIETGKLLIEERLPCKRFEGAWILGGRENIWLFIDGRFSIHDKTTLKPIADNSTICGANPFLEGKLPNDLGYVRMSADGSTCKIMAKDGRLFTIDTVTFKATEAEDEVAAVKKAVAVLERELSAATDPETQRVLRGKIDEYKASITLGEARLRLSDQIAMRHLQGAEGSLIVKSALAGGMVFSLLTDEETSSASVVLHPGRMPAAERRSLYQAAYDGKKSRLGSVVMVDGAWTPLHPSQVFLNGGFVTHPSTMSAVLLHDPEGFLIMHKKEIGDEGLLLLSRIDRSGGIVWETELPLTRILQLEITPDRLLLFSNDGKKTSLSNRYSFYVSVDLRNGAVVAAQLP